MKAYAERQHEAFRKDVQAAEDKKRKKPSFESKKDKAKYEAFKHMNVPGC